MVEKRVLLPLVLAALVVGGTASGPSAGTPRHAVPSANPISARAASRIVRPRQTRRLRAATWRWEAVIGRRRSRLAVPLDTRTALRRHFEVDAGHIVVSVLSALASSGAAGPEEVEKAIDRYDINAEAPDPRTA